jgi:Tol biopolymer transport system component
MDAAGIPMVESSERGKIAFARLLPDADFRVKSVWDIYTVNANGTDLRQLTHGAHAYEFWYSPDGTQIAYIRRIWDGVPGKMTHTFQLCVMNADGTAQRCLEAIGDISGAMWTPDGKRLIYSTTLDKGTQSAAYITKLDGSEHHLMTAEDTTSTLSPFWKPNGYKYFEHPVLSPDSSKIALIGRDKHTQALLDVIEVKSGDSLQIEYARNEYNATIPAWSPDSSQIAFITAPLEDWWDITVAEALHVMNVQSGEVRKLIDVDLGSKHRHEVYPYAPVWSSDGARIAFVGLYDADNHTDDIYIIHPNGSDLRRVTIDGLPKASLAWIP